MILEGALMAEKEAAERKLAEEAQAKEDAINSVKEGKAQIAKETAAREAEIEAKGNSTKAADPKSPVKGGKASSTLPAELAKEVAAATPAESSDLPAELAPATADRLPAAEVAPAAATAEASPASVSPVAPAAAAVAQVAALSQVTFPGSDDLRLRI
jgi:hypothetical protein